MTQQGENKPTLASLLNKYKTERGFTVETLAERSGLSEQTVSNWFKGRVRRPQQWRDLLLVAAAMHLSFAQTDEILSVTGHPSLAKLKQAHPDEEILNNWKFPLAAIPMADTSAVKVTNVPVAKTDDADTPPADVPSVDTDAAWFERLEARFNQLAISFGQTRQRGSDGFIVVLAILVIFVSPVFYALGYFVPSSQRMSSDTDLLACVVLAALSITFPVLVVALTSRLYVSEISPLSAWQRWSLLLLGALLGSYLVCAGAIFALGLVGSLVQWLWTGASAFFWQPPLRWLWAILLTLLALQGSFWGMRRNVINWRKMREYYQFDGRHWFMVIGVLLVVGPLLGSFLYFFRAELHSPWAGVLVGMAVLVGGFLWQGRQRNS